MSRNEENAQRFRLLGVLLGLAVLNQCTMDLNLPPLFFKVGTNQPTLINKTYSDSLLHRSFTDFC